jgi:hypothetical protein
MDFLQLVIIVCLVIGMYSIIRSLMTNVVRPVFSNEIGSLYGTRVTVKPMPVTPSSLLSPSFCDICTKSSNGKLVVAQVCNECAKQILLPSNKYSHSSTSNTVTCCSPSTEKTNICLATKSTECPPTKIPETSPAEIPSPSNTEKKEEQVPNSEMQASS